MIFSSDTRARRDLARPLRGTVKDRLSSGMDALAMTEAAACRRDALVMKKAPPIKPVGAPTDLIGGLPIRGWGASRIGSGFRLHRFLDARAVAWGGQVRYVVIPLMRAARFNYGFFHPRTREALSLGAR